MKDPSTAHSYSLSKLFGKACNCLSTAEDFFLIFSCCDIFSFAFPLSSEWKGPRVVSLYPEDGQLTVKRGDEIKLEVVVDSAGPVTFAWLHRHHANSYELREVGQESCLRIKRATDSDQGTYQCRISNQYSSASSKPLHVMSGEIEVTVSLDGGKLGD